MYFALGGERGSNPLIVRGESATENTFPEDWQFSPFLLLISVL